MFIKEVFLFRAFFIALIGVALAYINFGTDFLKAKKKSGQAALNVFIIICCLGLLWDSASNLCSSFKPVLVKRSLCADDISFRLIFEANGTFSNEDDEYYLTVPTQVTRKDLGEPIKVGTTYEITFDDRTDVVVEIHKLSDA